MILAVAEGEDGKMIDPDGGCDKKSHTAVRRRMQNCRMEAPQPENGYVDYPLRASREVGINEQVWWAIVCIRILSISLLTLYACTRRTYQQLIPTTVCSG